MTKVDMVSPILRIKIKYVLRMTMNDSLISVFLSSNPVFSLDRSSVHVRVLV